MAKNVVILGAGWAGLPLAHRLLKYTAPQTDIKVILVTPNSHFFWNVAATRGVIPGEIPDKDLFLPIEKGFQKYPGNMFELVLGRAEAIDTASSTVNVRKNDGSPRSVVYDQLIIATGSHISSKLPFKPVGTHEETLAAWQELQSRVKKAKSIVVAGAGSTGVEIAGELAAKYTGSKTVTLISSGSAVLVSQPGLLPSVQDVVAKQLQKLGVKVINNARASSATAVGDRTTVTLSNNATLEADCYIPVYGLSLNTSFIPSELLDSGGNVNLDKTMKVKGTRNVWAIGDVGNLEPKQLTVTDNQIIHLAKALDVTLTGKGEVPVYKPMDKTMAFYALGKKHATGQIGTWRLFGILVAWVKGRKLFVDTAPAYVNGESLRHASM